MLHFDPATVIKRHPFPTAGRVHAILDGHAFPHADWDDFPALVAIDFIGVTWRLLVRREATAALRFRRAPATLHFSREAAAIRVTGAGAGFEPRSEEFRPFELQRSALAAARFVAAIPDERTWRLRPQLGALIDLRLPVS